MEKVIPGELKERKSLACRILAVADTFDSMTNDRVYRNAINIEEAIKSWRGMQAAS